MNRTRASCLISLRNAAAAAILIVMFAGAAAYAAEAQTSCTIKQVASFDMGINSFGEVLVALPAESRPLNFMLDTGSPYSMVTMMTAYRLKLKRHPLPPGLLQFYGNRSVNYTADVDWTHTGKTVAMGIMPDAPRGTDGLLGMDVMSNFDVELDFFKGKVNLFEPNKCNAAVYWTQSAFVRLPFRAAGSKRLMVPATLDGKRVDVFFDTGATHTLWSLETAQAYLKTIGDPGKITPSPHPREQSSVYPFATLAFEGLVIKQPDIMLVPDKQSGMRDEAKNIIVGRNILRQLHIYIAYEDKAIYLTSATAH